MSYTTPHTRKPKSSGLSREALVDLCRRRDEGDVEARNAIVEANQRLLWAIARKFAGRGMDEDDLVGEGQFGLIRAADDFDPGFDTTFSTYAKYWIVHTIQHGLKNTAHQIRIPVYMEELLAKRRKVIRELGEELGRPPSDAEVAAKLDLKANRAAILSDAVAVRRARSLQCGEDGDYSCSAMLVMGCHESPHDAVDLADELRAMRDELGRLDRRERAILEARFGLDGEPPRTYREIGERIGLTRDWVRKIEGDALARLRREMGGE